MTFFRDPGFSRLFVEEVSKKIHEKIKSFNVLKVKNFVIHFLLKLKNIAKYFELWETSFCLQNREISKMFQNYLYNLIWNSTLKIKICLEV